MTEMVLMGGFASSKRQIETVAADMSTHLGRDILGMPLVKALRDPESAAEVLHDREVITHSAGAYATYLTMNLYPQCRPESVTFVAAPVPTSRTLLLRRSPLVATNLALESLRHPATMRQNVLNAGKVVDELLRFHRDYYGAFTPISQFDSFEAAYELGKGGTAVEQVFMEHDELFPFTADIEARVESLELSAHVMKGQHADLLISPSRFLKKFEQKRKIGSATLDRLVLPDTIAG